MSMEFVSSGMFPGQDLDAAGKAKNPDLNRHMETIFTEPHLAKQRGYPPSDRHVGGQGRPNNQSLGL